MSPGGDIPLFGARTSRAAEPSMLLVDPRGNGVWEDPFPPLDPGRGSAGDGG